MVECSPSWILIFCGAWDIEPLVVVARLVGNPETLSHLGLSVRLVSGLLGYYSTIQARLRGTLPRGTSHHGI